MLHKHRLCDKIQDCHDGTDEKFIAICRAMTAKVCHRAYQHEQALEMPLAWVEDGVEDCLDGMDEEEGWQTCGVGRTKRNVVADNQPCEEVLLCRNDQTAFVELKDLCDGIDTCGYEDGICKSSHIIASTFNNALTVNRAGEARRCCCIACLV